VLVRRVILAFCAVFLAAVIATAVADRQAQSTRAVAPPQEVAGTPGAPVVRGSLPGDRVVRANVGDVVSIAVTTTEPDEATIPELGVDAPTSGDVPGVLEFVADAPGRYPVLRSSDQRPLGTLVVAPAPR
jgi:FtsP/CotA-like multicopper oxidase with cupredoxin domain